MAVFLHGYPRTTQDVDLFASDLAAMRDALAEMGASFGCGRREFTLDGVPIHLVTVEQTGDPPADSLLLRGVRVVSLPDLIRFKLRSGLARADRAQDLADVVELIRRVPLDKRFAARLRKDQRSEFSRLVDAVRRPMQ